MLFDCPCFSATSYARCRELKPIVHIMQHHGATVSPMSPLFRSRANPFKKALESLISPSTRLRSAMPARIKSPCLSVFWVPFGGPVDRPPCILRPHFTCLPYLSIANPLVQNTERRHIRHRLFRCPNDHGRQGITEGGN